MDLATLGLRIVNDAALRALDTTSRKLDEMGAKADVAAAKAAAVGGASTRAAGGVAAAGRAATEAGQAYARLSDQELSNATAWFDRTYGSASKAAAATEAVATSGRSASLGMSRLRYSLSSTVAQMTGMSPIATRVGSTVAAMGTSMEVVVGALAGIAAADYVWRDIEQGVDGDAKALGKLQDEIARTKDALGGLRVQAASTNLRVAESLLAGHGGAATLFSRAGMSALWAGIKGLGGGPAGAAAAYAQSLATSAATGSQLQSRAQQDAAHLHADAFARLLRNKGGDPMVRGQALALLAQDRHALAALTGKTDDASLERRVALSGDVSTLSDALFPKARHHRTPVDHAASARWSQLNRDASQLSHSIAAGLGHSDLLSSLDAQLASYGQKAGKLIAAGAAAELRAMPDPFTDLIGRIQLAEAQLRATNTVRAAHGQSLAKPSHELVVMKRQAADMGQVMEAAILSWHLPLQQTLTLLKQIEAAERKIGNTAPHGKQGPSGRQRAANEVASVARSSADAMNLFGSGARAQQYASIANTGANAIDDFTSGHLAHGVLAVASLGRQIFSLGRQSHDAARRLQEARDAVNNMLASLTATLHHDALGALTDQAKAADDARRSQINSALSGKKHEAERNRKLAQDAALYAQQLATIQEQYAKAQQFDSQSLQARMLRAKGLTYQADMADLAVKQQQEYNQAVLAGKDATYLATLTQVQFAEKAALANRELTTLANAPSGFFGRLAVNGMASQYVTRGAPGTLTPSVPTAPSTNPPGHWGTTITGPVTINVPPGATPHDTARHVVRAIRELGHASGGINITTAEAMDYIA